MTALTDGPGLARASGGLLIQITEKISDDLLVCTSVLECERGGIVGWVTKRMSDAADTGGLQTVLALSAT